MADRDDPENNVLRKNLDPTSEVKCTPGAGRHRYVREVRNHPTREGKSQDRMACTQCEHVLYDWAGCFTSPTANIRL